MKDHPNVSEEWFENFYKEGLVETTAAAAAAQIRPPAIPLPPMGSPTPSNSSSGSSSSKGSKGKSKRVKREN
jgi:histone deacetylase complex regulatory component SIN3